MSLLLQALQKAAKSREEGEVELSAEPTAMKDEFTLEPASPVARVHAEAPPSPTSAQAATLVRAGSAPGFDLLDYAREHYMLSFVGVAFLLAVAYGTYVYLQVNRPFRSSAPALVPIAQSPQTPVATSTPPSSASAKISGMPGETAAATSIEVTGPRS